ncbi:complex I subunit 5 family protein [Candidatus Xenohaliotis californiensis]
MKDWEDVRSFFSLIAVTIFSTFLAAFAANMITLFVAYELMTIATYPLVRYNKTDEANKSAKVYLFTLLSTSMALLMPAIIYLYNLNPTILDFHASINSTITIQNNELLILLLCMLYGSAKAALFPVHFWLPMAMVAPMPVSALLHAVAVVKMGVFVIIRMVFFVLNVVNNQTQEPFYVLTYISIASMIYASVYALQENVIKKRLAYSTIAQLAYISMVTSLRTKQAFIAAMFHMVAHAFAKITLFFCTGVIYKNTGKTTVTGMRGTARVMPFTMTCFTIAAASIIGLPPTIGFVSKYLILQAFGQELTTLLVCVLSVGSLFSLLYLAPIVLQSLKKARSDKALPIKENCSWALFAIFLTTLIVLVCIAIPVDKIFLR